MDIQNDTTLCDFESLSIINSMIINNETLLSDTLKG